MQTRVTKLLRASALTVSMLTVLPNAFAESEVDDPPVGVNLQVVTNEELQTRLLNTLENAQSIADGIGMREILGDQIEAARASVLSATPQELEAIPPSLYSSLKTLEIGSDRMRLTYDPELRTRDSEKSRIQQAYQGIISQSTGPSYDDTALDAPGYPGQDWSFTFEAGAPEGDPEDPDGGSGESHGSCHAPGSTYPARVAALNSAIVANAINDISDHFCEFVVLGFNVAPLCVVTEVIAAITVGIDENMSLCNEHIGAAEVSATWEGLKTVHGNVQHVHDDLAIVEGDLASHDTDIKLQISTHDTDVKSQVATHDTDIKLQVATHDTDLKRQLATHDADIKARLGKIQSTVDENQRLLNISMARQLEILRLLLTPSGNREINLDVINCTGADCPPLNEILSCKNGLDWPCK